MSEHPLLQLFVAAADGRFPPVDGGVTVVPPYSGGLEAAVAFTGHAVVATDLDRDELLDAGADGYGAVHAPAVLQRLAGPGGWIGVHDATLIGRGTGGGALPRRHDLDDHPRVRHATSIRQDVAVHGDDRGLVTLGRGLAGRLELSIEVVGVRQGHGVGAGLLADGLALVPEGAVVFAAVAPGNARSLRLFLRAGFVPIASEVVIRPGR